MKILFISSGFPPFEFSENIVNGKLVLALLHAGYNVEVITKCDNGPLYNDKWSDPWMPLSKHTNILEYTFGNRFYRVFDITKKSIKLNYPIEGIRWAGLAYDQALKIIKEKDIDVIMTRSPSDISHLVGLKLKKKTGIRWIANWNDPATGIWPGRYAENLSPYKKILHSKFNKEVLSSADINTFPSFFLMEHFKNCFRLEDHKATVIPHIMLQDFIPVQGRQQTDTLKICHAGNLSKERDPRLLFKVMHKLIFENKKKISLDILGIKSAFVENQVKEYGLTDHVSFREPRCFYKSLSVLSDYDVLLILESIDRKGIFLPSKIVDYAQVGKPILALSPHISEVSGLINNYGGGITANNESIDDIESKMLILLDLKAGNRLEELISQKLHQLFHPENIIKKYADIL